MIIEKEVVEIEPLVLFCSVDESGSLPGTTTVARNRCMKSFERSN